MNETDRQTMERMRCKSEYVKAADDFSRYAHKEWVSGSDGERALLMCCIDKTTPDGMYVLNVSTGNKDLIAAGVAKMMQDDDLDNVFRTARIASETYDGLEESVRNYRSKLRTLYFIETVNILWTLCVIGFQVFGIANWITTVSNLLMMTFFIFLTGREIAKTRRITKRLAQAVRRDIAERTIARANSAFEDVLRRLKTECGGDDDEDDDDE